MILAALVLGQGLALFGSRLSMIAIPWLVLTEMGAPVLAGIVAFAELAPYVIAKAAGGPVLDRAGARRVSILCDLASIPVLAAVPLLYGAGLLSPAPLIALVALLGALRGPADGAKLALVPEVAARADVPLSRVTGLMGSVDRLASVLGAAGAAALIAALGPAPALWVNAALVAGAAAILALGVKGVGGASPADEASYLTQLAEGWRFLRGEPTLLAITLMVAVTNLLDQGMAVVLTPVWAERTGGIGHLGAVQVAFSAAAILGSLIASAIAERLPRLTVYVAAFVLIGLRYALFAALPPLPVLIAVSAIAGLSAGFVNPIVGALIFERVPARLVGRVTSLFTAIAWSLMPLGGLLAGAAVAVVGLEAALLAFGGLYTLAALSPLLVPGFRRMGHAPPSADLSAARSSASGPSKGARPARSYQ